VASATPPAEEDAAAPATPLGDPSGDGRGPDTVEIVTRLSKTVTELGEAPEAAG